MSEGTIWQETLLEEIEKSYESLQITVVENVYEPLVTRDKDYKLAPALATAWKQTAPNVWRFDLRDNDRARTDGDIDGGLVVVTGKGRIVGAHVLAPHAGEVIHELALAVHRQLRVEDLTDLVHVYPTIASSIGQLAAEAMYEKAHRLRWLMKRGDSAGVSDRVRRGGRRRGRASWRACTSRSGARTRW